MNRTKAQTDAEQADKKVTNPAGHQPAIDGHKIPIQSLSNGLGREPVKSALTPELPELEEVSQVGLTMKLFVFFYTKNQNEIEYAFVQIL